MAFAYRNMARNVYAKYADCTRREAERRLIDVSDEECELLALLSPEEAKGKVKALLVASAEEIVSKNVKAPSAAATEGLSVAAEGPTGKEDGESETGLDPSAGENAAE